MKYFVLCALSFFIGSIVGGVSPKYELQKFKQKKYESIMVSDKDCQKSTIGSDLAQIMASNSSVPNTRPKPSQQNPFGDRSPQEIEKDNPEAVEIAKRIDDNQERFQEEFPDSFERSQEELETARTALELRRAQARAALIEGAEPNDDQLADIDQAVQDMNDSLLTLSGELTDMMENGEEPERRQAMSFAAEALDTMLTAEDRFRDALSQDQIDALDDQALDPFSYISPDIIDTLQSLDQ